MVRRQAADFYICIQRSAVKRHTLGHSRFRAKKADFFAPAVDCGLKSLFVCFSCSLLRFVEDTSLRRRAFRSLDTAKSVLYPRFDGICCKAIVLFDSAQGIPGLSHQPDFANKVTHLPSCPGKRRPENRTRDPALRKSRKGIWFRCDLNVLLFPACRVGILIIPSIQAAKISCNAFSMEKCRFYEKKSL